MVKRRPNRKKGYNYSASIGLKTLCLKDGTLVIFDKTNNFDKLIKTLKNT